MNHKIKKTGIPGLKKQEGSVEMRVLIAEDEKPLAKALVKILEKNHISADAVENGQEALDVLKSENYDALILDVMMPVMDGFTALQKLREANNRIPVLILSAKGELDDRVTGLDNGASYYLVKPFEMKELLAALRVITREHPGQDNRVRFGNATLDRSTYQLSTPEGVLDLANKEFQLMEMLMMNPNQKISAEQMMDRIWGYEAEAEIDVIWTYISALRRKLKLIHADFKIKSTRNIGYFLEQNT